MNQLHQIFFFFLDPLADIGPEKSANYELGNINGYLGADQSAAAPDIQLYELDKFQSILGGGFLTCQVIFYNVIVSSHRFNLCKLMRILQR